MSTHLNARQLQLSGAKSYGTSTSATPHFTQVASRQDYPSHGLRGAASGTKTCRNVDLCNAFSCTSRDFDRVFPWPGPGDNPPARWVAVPLAPSRHAPRAPCVRDYEAAWGAYLRFRSRRCVSSYKNRATRQTDTCPWNRGRAFRSIPAGRTTRPPLKDSKRKANGEQMKRGRFSDGARPAFRAAYQMRRSPSASP